MSHATVPSLRAASLVPATAAVAGSAAAAKPNHVKERGANTGRASHASTFVPLDGNGRARYFVILEGDPVASTSGLPTLRNKKRKDMASQAAQNRLAQLQSQQASFVSSLTSSLGRTVAPLMQFQHALNAVYVELTPGEAATVAAQPGVSKVNRERVKELKTYNTHTLIGADTVWTGTSTPNNIASMGEGMVIGEIDSGINWTSKSFAATGGDGYTVANPLGSGQFLGNCLVNGTIKNGYTSRGTDYSTTTPHCNNKLIGIYNTEYNANDIYNPASGQDLDGHGSHTASTAGGNVVNGATYGGGTFNVSGVAPHANIIAYLACGTANYSCSDSGLAAAYNQAVADNIVDAINYSIGGPESSPWDSTIQLAALGAMDAGIFVAEAAGNDGPDAGSIDGNASPWTTTVAASSPAKIVSFAFGLSSLNGSSIGLPAATQGLAAIAGAAPQPTTAYPDLPLIVSPNFADGSNDGCSAYPANYFKRGSTGGIAVLHLDQNASNCGSDTRRTAAAAAGATVVVYVDDDFIDLGATGASYSVLTAGWNAIVNTPGIDLGTDGNATASLGYPVSANTRAPDRITTYSSRGPVAFDELKPDITAPGDNVLAAMSPMSTGGYGAANLAASSVIYGVDSGTSMATPHITGSAILVRAIHPTWTPMQVKSALMTTATKVRTNDGGAEADPTMAGAGRVDLTKAALASLLFDETKANFLAADPANGGEPATLNLASYYAFNCVDTCAFPRTVSSALAVSGNWTIAVTGLPPGSYALDKTSFGLAAGASTSYTLTIAAKQLAQAQWHYGTLTLTSSDSSLPVQHLPIAIRPGTPALRAAPAALNAHATVGQTVTRQVTIGNAGNPGLSWSIPTTTLKAALVSRPFNSGDGYADRTIVTSANDTQITSASIYDYYQADYFDIYGSGTTVDGVSVYGFGYNTTNGATAISTIMSQLALRIWNDNGGNLPNGRPGNTVGGDQDPVFQFPASAGGLGPASSGITYSGTSFDQAVNLDLAAAGAIPPALTPGRYWLGMTPSIVSTTGSGTSINSANYWYRGISLSASKTPSAQIAVANSAGSAVNRAWLAINGAAVSGDPAYSGLATRVIVNAACSAPWLSYGSTGGSLGLGGSATVNVSFDATGLAVGTYKAYVCISGNGTSPTNEFTSDEDAILIPATFTVVAPPSSPTCTAAPNPAGGTQTVTISCSGADADTTNTIPGAHCSAVAAGSFTCTGSGSDIGSNPTLTSTTAAGDSAYVTVALTVDTTAPATPSCTASPTSAPSGTPVTVTCTGVAAGTTNSFPGVSCTPNPADAGGTITCTGTSEAFGTNPVLTSTNALGNRSDATVSFTQLSGYVSLNPARILDTRANGVTSDGLFAGGGAVSGPGQLDLAVLGRGGIPLGGVKAVVLNVTDTQPTVPGYLTIWPTGSSRPNASNLNVVAGQTIANLVVVKLGNSGKISIFNSAGSSHVVADVQGYFTDSADLTSLVPARLLDTRAGWPTIDGLFEGQGAVTAAGQVDLTVAGRGGAPASGLGAVILNVTATQPTAPGYITAWPSDQSRPLASNLNFVAGQTIPNLVVAKVSAGGQVSLYNSAGSTHLIADVMGTFPAASDLHALIPARLLDTRPGAQTADGGSAGGGALPPGNALDLSVTGRGGVPADGVGSVAFNLTVTQPTAPGYLTAWPTGSARPLASNLNFVAGQTIPNLVIVKVGAQGKVSLYNSDGNSHVVVDVVGWFPPSP